MLPSLHHEWVAGRHQLAYRRVGLFYAKHGIFGVDSDDTLVVQGSSRSSTARSTRAGSRRCALLTRRRRSEWDGEFRDDLATFLDDAVIDRAVDRSSRWSCRRGPAFITRPLLIPVAARLAATATPSAMVTRRRTGGSSSTSCAGIKGRSTRHGYRGICRALQGIPDWGRTATPMPGVGERGLEHGVRYEKAELNASMLYLEALPLWTRGLVSIPDHPALVRELRLLERIPGRIGKDQVTHPRGVHDDLANVTCGALAMPASASSGEWMRHLGPVIARLQQMPRYRRPIGDDRIRHGEAIYGERRFAQMTARRW